MIYIHEIPVVRGLGEWSETPCRLQPPERNPIPRPEPREPFDSTISRDIKLLSGTKPFTNDDERSLTL